MNPNGNLAPCAPAADAALVSLGETGRLNPDHANGNSDEVRWAPPHEEIAECAYFIYLDRGCPEGRAEQHWLLAEAHLLRLHELHRTTRC